MGATKTVYPDYSTGLYRSQYTKVGTFPDSLASNDGDTSYVKTNDAAALQDVKSTQWPSGMGSVESVRLLIRSRQEAADYRHVYGGFSNYGYSQSSWTNAIDNYHATSTAYASSSLTTVANPNGSGVWLPSEVVRDNIVIRFDSTATGATPIRITYAYAVVYYTPAAGGFTWLLGSWVLFGLRLPGLLVQMGGGLGPEHMAAIRLELARQSRGHHTFDVEDELAVLRDLKDWRRPSFALLGR